MLWRDVDLANGRFVVGRDKTDAGVREVDMLPLLREILTEHKAARKHAGPDDPVFVTSTGKPRSRHNIRQDVVGAVVSNANKLVKSAAYKTCCSGSPRTSCGIHSPRFSWRSARTRPT